MKRRSSRGPVVDEDAIKMSSLYSSDAGSHAISPETEDKLFNRPNPPTNLTVTVSLSLFECNQLLWCPLLFGVFCDAALRVVSRLAFLVRSLCVSLHLFCYCSANQIMKDLIKGCQDGHVINVKLAMSILDESFCLQRTFPNIRAADSRTTHKITVVGDLHGKLIDLLMIFEKVRWGLAQFFLVSLLYCCSRIIETGLSISWQFHHMLNLFAEWIAVRSKPLHYQRWFCGQRQERHWNLPDSLWFS